MTIYVGNCLSYININFQEQWDLMVYRPTSVYVRTLHYKSQGPKTPPAPVSGQANWLLVIPNYVELLLLDRLAVPPHNFAG